MYSEVIYDGCCDIIVILGMSLQQGCRDTINLTVLYQFKYHDTKYYCDTVTHNSNYKDIVRHTMFCYNRPT